VKYQVLRIPELERATLQTEGLLRNALPSSAIPQSDAPPDTTAPQISSLQADAFDRIQL